MKKSVSEMAKLSGVSVRTLHYYDEIGLLKPHEVISETGYRYYDEEDMERLQQILFYRELDFPLKEIIAIMNASEYKKEDALAKQKELLILKRNRLNSLIKLLDANLKGDNNMSFTEFDMSEIEAAKAKYAKEVEEKWGATVAYKQNLEKTSKFGKEDWQKSMEQMDSILKKFADLVGTAPEDKKVQSLVSEWKQYITDYFYECTDEILDGLGQMYIADERFTTNMDKFKKGTTELISSAISIYCK